MTYDPLVAALWGGAGTFIYAAPQWAACLVNCWQHGEKSWRCTLEFVVAMLSGIFAAAAFTGAAVHLAHLPSEVALSNAVAAFIGLLANTTAPLLIKRASAVVAVALGERLGKAAGESPGGEHEP